MNTFKQQQAMLYSNQGSAELKRIDESISSSRFVKDAVEDNKTENPAPPIFQMKRKRVKDDDKEKKKAKQSKKDKKDKKLKKEKKGEKEKGDEEENPLGLGIGYNSESD
jgi:hypothetical protein